MKFKEKLKIGEVPDSNSWTEYVKESHEEMPGMTPMVFGLGKTVAGISSYEELANLISAGKKLSILDLACGDGYLSRFVLPRLTSDSSYVGVDMSEADISKATQSVLDERAVFKCGNALALPLKDNSIDIIVCHMALMLMLPLDEVVKELSRVLRPNGQIFAVIANSKSRSGLFKAILDECFKYIDQWYPKVKEVKTGDSRLSSLSGLKELFSESLKFNSQSIESNDFEIHFEADVDGAWDIVKDMYFIGMLSPNEKNTVQTAVGELVRSLIKSGNVSIEIPLKMIKIKRN